MSTRRLLIALTLVTGTAVMAGRARVPGSGRPAAFDIPYTIAAWAGDDARPLDAATEQDLGADLILNRTYVAPGEGAIGLYLAYYEQQRPGVSIHSPRHCLPGTGWDILSDATIRVPLIDGSTGPVRRLVAQKATAQVLVLYWYSIQGRMIANDVLSRFQLLSDRLRFGRNDGALVRLVVPLTEGASQAERRGVAFVRAVAPYLSRGSDRT